jgi:hypothetical protein
VPHQRIDWLPFDQDPGTDLQGAAAAVAGLHRQAERERFRSLLIEVLIGIDREPPPGTDQFFHADLPTRSLAELQRERARLRLGLLLHPDAPRWWRERLRALEGALRQR